jgi:hypothetical protein
MPTFEITAPNGQTYEVTGDNAEGAYTALISMLGETDSTPAPKTTPTEPYVDEQGVTRYPNLQQVESGAFEDVVGAGLAGMARGAKGLAETPEMLVKGIGRLRQEADYGFGNVPEDQKINPFDTLTGQGIDAALSTFGGDKAMAYRGESRPARVAGTVGEFVGPTGLVGGLGKLTKSQAMASAGSGSGLATAAIAGTGSEVAGQLLEDSAWEMPARIAGAFLVPAAISVNTYNKTLNAIRNKNVQAPTVQSLKSEKNYAYDQVKKSGQRFSTDETQDMVNRAIRSAFNQGAYSATDDATMAAVDLLEGLRGQGISLAQHDKIVRKMGKMYNKAKDQPEILTMMKSMDDSLAQKAGSENLISVARAANSKYAKASLLEKEFGKIERKVAAGNAGDVVGKYKNSLNKILENPNKAKFFSDEEVMAMKSIVEGSVPQNIINIAGKLAPNGNGLMTYLNIVTASINPAFLGLTAASGTARKLSQSQIKKATKQLQDLVAAGGASRELIDRNFINSLFPRTAAFPGQLTEDQQ